ncbi:MAG TPA: tyrosine-type recombinase/integrase [Tepidisphaeraceae bacterium]|nr:tyrosine-type recombinase/integrase [Tepidisphaeraceae bacterium]
MLTTTAKKRGRPQGRYRLRDGNEIQGLTRRADGRWKISATGQTFIEPDERLAVERFHKLSGTGKPSNLGTLQVHASAEAAMLDLLQRTVAAGGRLDAETAILHEKGVEAFAVSDDTLTRAQWAWLNEQLITRRQWVAQQVGVEQIAWLTDLKRPAPAQTLKELGELYVAKQGLSGNEVSRSKLFWKEFCNAAGVNTVPELTHDHVIAYERVVQSGNYAAKTVLHRYRKVRTILAYAIKRGRGVEECRRALDMTAMLEVKDAHPLDPQPIAVEDFWAVQKQAVTAGDTPYAALMLTALNAAMYAGEVAALKWEEVDLASGELVTRRSKTGVSRVAVLWPETIKALKKVDRRGDYIFNTSRRSYLVNSVLKVWRRYRADAKLADDVTFSGIRDAGFTIACRAATLDQARVLAGHRLPGATDFYVRRNPQFVADACAAIRAEFFRIKGGARRALRSR